MTRLTRLFLGVFIGQLFRSIPDAAIVLAVETLRRNEPDGKSGLEWQVARKGAWPLKLRPCELRAAFLQNVVSTENLKSKGNRRHPITGERISRSA